MAPKTFSIKHCGFGFECPGAWEQLAVTSNANERHCETCAKIVYLSHDDESLSRHVQAGHCVGVEDGMNAGSMTVGQIAPEYPASKPEAAPEKFYLKIEPSPFNQKAVISSTDWL